VISFKKEFRETGDSITVGVGRNKQFDHTRCQKNPRVTAETITLNVPAMPACVKGRSCGGTKLYAKEWYGRNIRHSTFVKVINSEVVQPLKITSVSIGGKCGPTIASLKLNIVESSNGTPIRYAAFIAPPIRKVLIIDLIATFFVPFPGKTFSSLRKKNAFMDPETVAATTIMANTCPKSIGSVPSNF